MLATSWQFDTLGISTINKSLVNNLRVVDSTSAHIHITCAVLEEEGKITEAELKDVAKYGVKLRGARQPRGKKRRPEMQWLDEDVAKYYRHLVVENVYDFIIGHVPYLTDGSLNLRDLSKDFHKGHSPKVILVAHALPLTEEGELDEECLAEWLKETDTVLSIGNNIFMKIDSCLDEEEQVDHKLYLPGFPLDFFKIQQKKSHGAVKGEQNILPMTAERKNLEVIGLNFELAVVSSAKVSQNITYNEGSNLSKQISFNIRLIGFKEDDKSCWEELFKTIIQQHNFKGRAPSFRFYAPHDIKKLMPHIKRAAVLILPLDHDSPLFGTQALIAIAAGVPVLVSRNSGIASLLQSKGLSEPIVWDNDGFTKDVETWTERLIHRIINPRETRRVAQQLRILFLLDHSIASTHLDFINTITGTFEFIPVG